MFSIGHLKSSQTNEVKYTTFKYMQLLKLLPGAVNIKKYPEGY